MPSISIPITNLPSGIVTRFDLAQEPAHLATKAERNSKLCKIASLATKILIGLVIYSTILSLFALQLSPFYIILSISFSFPLSRKINSYTADVFSKWSDAYASHALFYDRAAAVYKKEELFTSQESRRLNAFYKAAKLIYESYNKKENATYQDICNRSLKKDPAWERLAEEFTKRRVEIGIPYGFVAAFLLGKWDDSFAFPENFSARFHPKTGQEHLLITELELQETELVTSSHSSILDAEINVFNIDVAQLNLRLRGTISAFEEEENNSEYPSQATS